MDINWWKARAKEASTKWGAVIVVVVGAALFTTEQLGDYYSRLSAAAALVGAYRLVVVQESPEATERAPGGDL